MKVVITLFSFYVRTFTVPIMYLFSDLLPMKIYYFLTVLLVFTYTSRADSKRGNGSIKATIIGEIMKKMSNLASNTLSKVSDNKKEIALGDIENKLKKSVVGLPNSSKYVNFIMEEIKRKRFDKKMNTTTQKENNERENIEEQINNLHFKKKSLNRKKESADIMNAQMKQLIITDIANKIESIAKAYLKDVQNFNQKNYILKKIEKRIIETSKRKHMQIHSPYNELKTFANLITQGLDMSLKRLLQNKTRRMDLTKDVIKSNIIDKDMHLANIEHINIYKIFISRILNESSIDPNCDEKVDEVCLRIRSLPKLRCGDEKIISLDQLCDGVPDCWNGTDEINCVPQVAEKVLQAIPLISDIERSITTTCLQPVIDGNTITYHHQVLQDMLKSQFNFLQNYIPSPINITSAIEEAHKKENKEVDTDLIYLKKIITNIAKSVSLLLYVLEENFCVHEFKMAKDSKLNKFTDKFLNNGLDNLVDNFKESTWSAKSCTCRQQFCITDGCDSRCKHVCFQKYILKRWGCQSIAGDQSISLNLICDGKLDCFDESDERACTTDAPRSKYEANRLYNHLVDILSLKSLSLEYEQEHIRNKFKVLIGLVRQLQKLTTKSHADIHAIKTLRKEYFQMLVNIYGDILQTSNIKMLDSIHKFLLVLNQKMVSALKHSHTGNEKLIGPTDCYCRNGTCALLQCPRKCISTCLVEPMLTTYSCKANNVSVPLKDICNEKKDCPNEEDEKDCAKDVCRSHHLVMLRHNLKEAGATLKGTILADILGGWKAKVMAALIVAEGGERPNHKILEDIIRNILRDLVSAYSEIEETRKNNSERVLHEFKTISGIVIKTLKSCRQ